MQRRDFIKLASCGALSVLMSPRWALASANGNYNNLLIILELKGGNDGLNTVVPYGDRAYYDLRPRIGIPRDQVLQLDNRSGLHPSLQPLMSLWESHELAVVQGVGYPDANLSHFRSIEIWDTASEANEYLSEGWLTRAFAHAPVPKSYAADGIIVGSSDLGPMEGGATRALALSNTEQFLRQAKLLNVEGVGRNAALRHILKVEQDIVQAASNLNTPRVLRTTFPNNQFGNALKTAAEVVASKAGIAVIKVTQTGFDTHSGQQGTQQRLLKEFADGLVAMRTALLEIGRWDKTLMMTYGEFGRRPKENQSAGTDHGTANAQFVLGGRVKGGLYGAPPELNRLDGNGNLPFAVDFRSLYATALEKWWGSGSRRVLDGKFETLDLVKV